MSEALDQATITAANDVGSKTGMGEPDLGEIVPTVEETAAKKEEKAPKSESESKSEEPEEGEDDAEEEDDEPHSRKAPKGDRQAKTVPYEKHKALRQENETLTRETGEIRQDLNKVMEILTVIAKDKTQSVAAKEEVDEIQQEAEDLAKEMGAEDGSLDPKLLAAIMKRTLKIVEKRHGKNALPKEKEELLERVEEREASDAEIAHFNKEWTAAVPTIKEMYPNAGDSQLQEAKELLDRLSHTEKFHLYDLEDIVNSPKNKKAFETILKVAPKGKSGETGKTIGNGTDTTEGEDDDDLVDLENLTPDIIRKREAKETAGKGTNPKDYKIQKPLK